MTHPEFSPRLSRRGALRGAALALLAGATAGLLAVGCRAQQPVPARSLRDEFRLLIQADRKSGPLRPQPAVQSDLGSIRMERVRFTPEEGHDAVALIYRPKAEAKYPTVIVQHFLGGSKDDERLAFVLLGLAQRGFLVAAIDGRYRGERQNGKSLEAAMLEALRAGKGRPFLLDSAHDVLRLIDYLETRPDVDAKRIGMTGFSEGGLLTWICAAADERIRVAAPVIGVTCFADAFSAEDGPDTAARLKLFEPVLKEYARDRGAPGPSAKLMREAFEKLLPGMTDRFDAPNLLPLIAPRPLLILSHERDELFPVSGTNRAYAAARSRYQELNAEDRLQLRVAPGLRHADFVGLLTEANLMAQWMERWLKAPVE